MQPMRLCIFSSKQSEATFENAHWSQTKAKVEQMQPMHYGKVSMGGVTFRNSNF